MQDGFEGHSLTLEIDLLRPRHELLTATKFTKADQMSVNFEAKRT